MFSKAGCSFQLITAFVLVLLYSSYISAPFDPYVVGFRSYGTEEELIAALVESLPVWNNSYGLSWRNLPRSYDGMENFPTDFVVVEIQRDKAEELILEVQKLVPEVFKWIEPDKTHKSGILSSRVMFPLASSAPNVSTGQFWVKRELLGESLNGSGTGVKVAVYDTGISSKYKNFRHLKVFIDLTGDKTGNGDKIGHGTFVAGVIANQKAECPGYAPDVELYVFKVFNSRKESLTSWFLDGFNYAIYKKIDIINLSNGGPDWKDIPFTEKISEMSAAGIVVVSAIGNDGPGFGTNYNPADMLEVIGVGGVDNNGIVAPFSSRGMTLWELPQGYGRVKPDIMANGLNIINAALDGSCTALSGTSVASPAVTGAGALIIEALRDTGNPINHASVKQVLHSSSHRLPKTSMFEQGSGRMDVSKALEAARNFSPHLSFFPDSLEMNEEKFYSWPLSSQPLYHTQVPFVFNVTVLCSACKEAVVSSVRISNYTAFPHLSIRFNHSERLTPYCGYMGVTLQVNEKVKSRIDVKGSFEMTVTCGNDVYKAEFPISIILIPTPPRENRILWDQFHNINFPPGYFPADSGSGVSKAMFDMNGDHPHTNFMGLYVFLLELGFFVEILGSPFLCVDPKNYHTLIIADPEEEFFLEEMDWLENALLNSELNLLVLGEWYSESYTKKLIKYDDVQKRLWKPATGFGIAFGEGYLEGKIPVLEQYIKVISCPEELVWQELTAKIHKQYDAGSKIIKFPAGSVVMSAGMTDISGRRQKVDTFNIGGFIDLANQKSTEDSGGLGAGRIVVFGDSTPFEQCTELSRILMRSFLQFLANGIVMQIKGPSYTKLTEDLDLPRDTGESIPTRLKDSQLNYFLHSKLFWENLCCIGSTEPLHLSISNSTSFPLGENIFEGENLMRLYISLSSYLIYVFLLFWGGFFAYKNRTRLLRMAKMAGKVLVS